MSDPARALQKRWADRDRRYVKVRPYSLTDAEIAAVREWRAREAMEIESYGLEAAARAWLPPVRIP